MRLRSLPLAHGALMLAAGCAAAAGQPSSSAPSAPGNTTQAVTELVSVQWQVQGKSVVYLFTAPGTTVPGRGLVVL
jgi:hypothetical protein